MNIRPYPIARSIASIFLPKRILRRPGSGGTFSSKYCYSVWLRHLNMLFANNLVKDLKEIKSIAEIGPGDSLGIGMCGLYTGANTYYAFDVIEHTNIDKNLKINDELFNYFINKMNIPNGKGFESVAPVIQNYSFPLNIVNFDSNYFSRRHKQINLALNKDSKEIKIEYIVPWYDYADPKIKNIDLIFSQAVMEHVDDIELAYKKMYQWLKPGGIICHQIDFKAHEMTNEWNGHWFISDSIWNFLLKGRKYPLNRLPLSAHIKAIENAGFEIKCVSPVERKNKFNNKKLKVTYSAFTEKDLITSGALIQATKS